MGRLAFAAQGHLSRGIPSDITDVYHDTVVTYNFRYGLVNKSR